VRHHAIGGVREGDIPIEGRIYQRGQMLWVKGTCLTSRLAHSWARLTGLGPSDIASKFAEWAVTAQEVETLLNA